VSDHVAVGAVHKPKAAEADGHILSGEHGLHLFQAFGPQSFHGKQLKETRDILLNLQVIGRNQDDGLRVKIDSLRVTRSGSSFIDGRGLHSRDSFRR